MPHLSTDPRRSKRGIYASFLSCAVAMVLLFAPRLVAAAEPGPPQPAAAVPWTVLESIWFFHDRAELTVSERPKIERIAHHHQEHPNAAIGISLPSDSSNLDSGRMAINPARVAAVRAAMIAAGIPATAIQEGVLANRESLLDRQILVMVQVDSRSVVADE